MKRLQKTIKGKMVDDSLYVPLENSATVVKDLRMSEFKSYVPPSFPGHTCQRYEHVAAFCVRKQSCPKYEGEHTTEDCGHNMQDKCCSCGFATQGNIMEVVKSGSGRNSASENNENLSYAVAVKKAQDEEYKTSQTKPHIQFN